MPWYYIYADHGPGHQSHSDYYKWFEERLSEQEKRSEFEESFGDRDWPIGKVKELKGLPVDVKKYIVKDTKQKKVGIVKECNKLLKILHKTTELPCAHAHSTRVGTVTRRTPTGIQYNASVSKCVHCGMFKVYGEKKWRKNVKQLG